jgi:predicted O-methyltransferase YrrM
MKPRTSEVIAMKRRNFLTATAGGLSWLVTQALAEAQSQTSLREKEKAIEPLLKELEALRSRFFNVPRTDGQFLNMLVKLSRSKRVLEVGTSNGYSAIWLCLALEETDGHLTTVEIDPERVKLAKENLKRAGLDHRVTFLEGDAHKIVPTLEGPFDFVFLDADKGREHDYFSYLYPKKLLPGAIIAVHNAIRMRQAMRRYLDMMSEHPEFDTLLVSTTLDDGFAISYRRRKK